MEKVKVGQKYNNRLVVSVRFNNTNTSNEAQKECCFFASEELDLYSGDMVVVDTRNGYGVAFCSDSEMSPAALSKANKWIVAKVDIEEHEARMLREKEIFDLKKAMENRLKEVEESMKYQRLAQMDPVMAEMYQKLTALDSESFPQLEDKK